VARGSGMRARPAAVERQQHRRGRAAVAEFVGADCPAAVRIGEALCAVGVHGDDMRAHGCGLRSKLIRCAGLPRCTA
jgi:hypothetical protein